MDITVAERALARYVAHRCAGMAGVSVLAGVTEVAEVPPMARVRFVAGRLAAEGTLPALEELTGQSGLENVFVTLVENLNGNPQGSRRNAEMGGGDNA